VPGSIRVTWMQRVNLIRSKLRNAVTIGFKIIDKEDVLDRERSREIAHIESPWQIRQLQSAIAHRSWEAKTRRKNIRAVYSDGASIARQEFVDDFVERGKVTRRKFLVTKRMQLSALKIVQSKVNLGTTDVPGKNHLVQLQSSNTI
jgi:hypothetical protein